MKNWMKMIALLLAVMVLLTGCGLLEGLSQELQSTLIPLPGTEDHAPPDGEDYPSFAEMEYVRPNMKNFEVFTNSVLRSAETETDVKLLMAVVNDFFDAYQWFYTYYSLADIHYCIDMTDPYWQEEYNYCLEQSATVDAAREEILYALADSPLREELENDEYFGTDYFDAYDGESIYDETFVGLLNEESAILNRYYQISADAAAVTLGSEEYYTVYGTQLADILVELIRVRQELASYCGYDSYPAFAYDFYHGRDFTPAQAQSYMLAVGEELSDMYRQVNTTFDWSVLSGICSEADTFAYVKKAANAMGGDIADGFWYLEEDGLYHISPGQNKYNSSFEVYLSCYEQGFIFMNPVQDDSDKLTFAHEFGHYMSDFYTWGSEAGTDVLEIQSQAMEYLSLVYAEADQALVNYKLVNCLCTYVEQSAYALFEQQMYDLEGENLTVENLQALYEEIGTDFGFDSWVWDSRDFVTVPHFYSYPMYIISYVVSNDLAFQIYQQELETPGAGLETYNAVLYSDQWSVIEVAKLHEMANPLDSARLQDVKNILRTVVEGK